MAGSTLVAVVDVGLEKGLVSLLVKFSRSRPSLDGLINDPCARCRLA